MGEGDGGARVNDAQSEEEGEQIFANFFYSQVRGFDEKGNREEDSYNSDFLRVYVCASVSKCVCVCVCVCWLLLLRLSVPCFCKC